MEDILSELGFDYEEIMNVDSDYFSGIFNAFKTGSIDDIDDRAKKEADEFKASKWGTFFLGCGTSLIFVTYIAIVCANFIYFSKLPINISIGEETIHTFFPIANESSFNKQRTKLNSKININKSIKSQFNLLRICDNERYPIFFNYKKKKFILKIYKGD